MSQNIERILIIAKGLDSSFTVCVERDLGINIRRLIGKIWLKIKMKMKFERQNWCEIRVFKYYIGVIGVCVICTNNVGL